MIGEPQVIDAAAWVPQHRERMLFVGRHRSMWSDIPYYQLPEPPTGGHDSATSSTKIC